MSQEFDPTVLAAPHKALVIGNNTLATATREVLSQRGVEIHSADHLADASVSSDISLIFNVWFPQPGKDAISDVAAYPQQLLEHSLAAADGLIAAHPSGAIVNFCFLPAIYVGTQLEDHTSNLRGGLTGVTRTICRKYGKQGLRSACVQGGLIEMPETLAWGSDTVKEVQVPTRRWANCEEVARFMAFLAIDSTYTTGQTMVIDGGLTSGITGT